MEGKRTMDPEIAHQVFRFRRDIAAPVERIFAALADASARAVWSCPSPTAVVLYDAADFRVGGEDRFRCGAREDPRFSGHTTYLAIQPPLRIVSAETVSTGGVFLAASLITTELAAQGERTRLEMTVQVTSLCGEGMLRGTEAGTNTALDNLVRFLTA